MPSAFHHIDFIHVARSGLAVEHDLVPSEEQSGFESFCCVRSSRLLEPSASSRRFRAAGTVAREHDLRGYEHVKLALFKFHGTEKCRIHNDVCPRARNGERGTPPTVAPAHKPSVSMSSSATRFPEQDSARRSGPPPQLIPPVPEAETSVAN